MNDKAEVLKIKPNVLYFLNEYFLQVLKMLPVF